MVAALGISDAAIEQAVAPVRQRFAVKPKVAIAGFGKSGKSSLFNAIYGAEAASVSMRTDETVEAMVRERFGIDFTDTPGIGTAKFSLESVIASGMLDGQHVVIHVLNGASAISAEDEQLHRALGEARSRRITVVNKMDLLDERERSEFAASMQEKLGLVPDAFLFISAKLGTNVPALVQRIAEALPEAMQDAFIGQQRADLAIKERRVRALIYSQAMLAGGVAITPIPIADIAVITPLQIAMVVAIGYFYNVEVDKKRALELLAVLGAGAGFREAARQVIKLVPGLGSAVSAGIAFAGTVALGEAANVWFKNEMKVDPAELLDTFKAKAMQAKKDYELRGGKVEAPPERSSDAPGDG